VIFHSRIVCKLEEFLIVTEGKHFPGAAIYLDRSALLLRAQSKLTISFASLHATTVESKLLLLSSVLVGIPENEGPIVLEAESTLKDYTIGFIPFI